MPCDDNASGKRKIESDISKIHSLDIGTVAFTKTVKLLWKVSESGDSICIQVPLCEKDMGA